MSHPEPALLDSKLTLFGCSIRVLQECLCIFLDSTIVCLTRPLLWINSLSVTELHSSSAEDVGVLAMQVGSKQKNPTNAQGNARVLVIICWSQCLRFQIC